MTQTTQDISNFRMQNFWISGGEENNNNKYGVSGSEAAILCVVFMKNRIGQCTSGAL